MDAAVGAEGEARAQRFFCLGWPHRHRYHLAAVSFLQLRRMRDSGRVEGIEQERDSLALELLRLLVELDRVRARYLFDEADDLHVWEPRRMKRQVEWFDANQVRWTAARADLERPRYGTAESVPWRMKRQVEWFAESVP